MSGTGQRAPSGPPPPARQSVQQRLQSVMQHQQFWWWVGHVVIVLATLASAAYWFRGAYASRMALFWYRLALIGAIGSYGVVVHKMFFRVRPLQAPVLTVEWSAGGAEAGGPVLSALSG